MTVVEIKEAANRIIAGNEHKYGGKDNYGKPKREYIEKLVQMTDEQLFEEMKSKIWLSAYAANNPRSDYHFHCDATWDEGKRRGKSDLYGEAHRKVSESI